MATVGEWLSVCRVEARESTPRDTVWCADKKTSRKGKEIDKWYSGKAHHSAGNVQALTAPGGVPLWVSDVLPGSTHDLTAARELVLPAARPYLNDLPVLADSGYEGAGAGVLVQ